MKFLDPLLKPFVDSAVEEYLGKLQGTLFDMERRRVNQPTFMLSNGTQQFGVYDDLTLDGGGVASVGQRGLYMSLGKNRLINGDFRVAQRGTSFTSGTSPANNDDTYHLDRWYTLSDGNNIVTIVQDSTTVPTNGQTAISLTVSTANKKFGIAQIVEAKNCKGLIGGYATFSFQAKVNATTNLDNVKCAIVSWSGTADTVTSDIVSAWEVEGTQPTLIANATYENSPTNLSLTTSYATYTVSAPIDTASAANLIVFIWSDVTATAGTDILYITDVQLESGVANSKFEHRDLAIEVLLCERYFEKSYNLAVTPGATSSVGLYEGNMRISTTTMSSMLSFNTRKRTTPTMTGYSSSTGTAGQWFDGTADLAVSFTNTGEGGSLAYNNATTAGRPFYGHWTAEAEL